MGIQEQFNMIAAEYDQNRRKFIPCFADFYQGSTDFLAANLDEPRRILDLGAGTGLLTSFWYRHYPAAEYVLVDIADEMLEVARRRFAGLSNVSCQILDYNRQLPEGRFELVVSALSVHHLTDADKTGLFKRIYDILPAGGWFVNYDQFCADQPEMDRWFSAYWENRLQNSGLTAHDLSKWRERRKLDRECSAAREMTMLRQSGFAVVDCVYACQKFSVIAAGK